MALGIIPCRHRIKKARCLFCSCKEEAEERKESQKKPERGFFMQGKPLAFQILRN